jgi:hypothetical protein
MPQVETSMQVHASPKDKRSGVILTQSDHINHNES